MRRCFQRFGQSNSRVLIQLCARERLNVARSIHDNKKAIDGKSSALDSTKEASSKELELTEWSLSGDNDISDQHSYLETRNYAFTRALETLLVMTPKTPTILFQGSYSSGIEDPSSSIPRSADHPKGLIWQRQLGRDTRNNHYTKGSFIRHIYNMTRRTPAISAEISQKLCVLFDDFYNRRRLNVTAYTIAVSYALRISDYRLLRHFVNHAQKRSIMPNTALCNTVLATFVHDNDLSSWNVALKRFNELGIKANTDTWNQLLTIADRQQKVLLLRQMQNANVEGNHITQAIMLPLRRECFHSTKAFLQSLPFRQRNAKFGDALIGELLRTKELTYVLKLLYDAEFQLSIIGFEQILSHMYRITTHTFNHSKHTRTVCAALTKRDVAMRPQTFVILFKLGQRIKNAAYSNMIYCTAVKQDLVNAALHRARKEQYRLLSEGARTRVDQKTLDWCQWLAGLSADRKVTLSV